MKYLEEIAQRLRADGELPEAEVAQILAAFDCRTIPKGELLLREGSQCDFWGFVGVGLVRAYTHTATGEEYTNGFVREGGFLTEIVSFYTQAPALENLVALEDTILIYTSFSKLQQLFKEFAGFEKFGRILYEQLLTQLKQRILYRIRFDAQTRYLHLVETQPDLLRRVPLKYLASYLNMTDSTLSRVRKKLLTKAS
ncbi:Crp/Fnr family transcriptional regulator [Hymenobacter sp. H14-R3]|uniref:Crp/Fnr family transcriptional regulator n=1 Tax=Hymenobacter sp. H14-R3 TaxID=3046308 RepID=UPI0024BAF4F8|nr:Crp/Fnr family transcriptional regulator [Hymenobacter sp. H14-R3]MDJ0367821.1 Crp/Fnr family transcriptional regulator [Hymenobacter sp. H14-R3]